jgi:hypothetical protein
MDVSPAAAAAAAASHKPTASGGAPARHPGQPSQPGAAPAAGSAHSHKATPVPGGRASIGSISEGVASSSAGGSGGDRESSGSPVLLGVTKSAARLSRTSSSSSAGLGLAGFAPGTVAPQGSKAPSVPSAAVPAGPGIAHVPSRSRVHVGPEAAGLPHPGAAPAAAGAGGGAYSARMPEVEMGSGAPAAGGALPAGAVAQRNPSYGHLPSGSGGHGQVRKASARLDNPLGSPKPSMHLPAAAGAGSLPAVRGASGPSAAAAGGYDGGASGLPAVPGAAPANPQASQSHGSGGFRSLFGLLPRRS